MANKRMFTMKICDSDAFLDMPLSAQCLYFHLNMRADDDGFVDNPKRILKVVGANDDDLRILISKRFLLTFEDGLIVIKHWRMHNTLSRNRYHETQYLDEKSVLLLKENGAYSFNSGQPIDDSKLIAKQQGNEETCGFIASDAQVTNKRSVNDAPMERIDLGLDIDLDIDKDIESNTKQKRYKRFVPPTLEDVQQYAKEKGYTNFNAEKYISYYESVGWKVGRSGKPMKSWKASISNWVQNDKEYNKPKIVNPKNTVTNNFEQRQDDLDALVFNRAMERGKR